MTSRSEPAEEPIGVADTRLTEAEIAAAVAVLRSGNLRQGPECAAFEAEFAARFGAKHAVANANGTTALHLAYACVLEPGDEVLVPSFTFIATASMVVAAGGEPVICDVDPRTGMIDLADAAARVTPRTRAIAPVHLFGNVCDVEGVRKLAERHGLAVIWDAAQAHGATWKGEGVAGLGDFTTYSFYPTKNMFVGEGGMTCTPDAALAEKLARLRDHGAAGRYNHAEIGYNFRLTDLAAAIGRQQLTRFDAMLARRRRNAGLLLDGLEGVVGLTLPQAAPEVGHAWHQFCILVEPEAFGRDRDGLAAFLAERDIGSAVHYPRGLHQQPVFVTRNGRQSLPATERLAETILALPVHHGLEDAQIARIVDGVRAASR